MSLRSIQVNPDLQDATWDDIRSKRDELEQSAITTSTGTYDADQKALLRMDSALAAFESLPTLVNDKLGWKTLDNLVVMITKSELEDIRTAISVRAATLHYQAGVIASGSYQVKDLEDLTIWGI